MIYRYSPFLAHYNHNHDSLGRFARNAKIRYEFSKSYPLDVAENLNEKREYHNYGVRKGLFSSDKIKKDSKIYRYSSNKNESIDGRKYALITNTDKKMYKRDALANALSNKGKDVYLYELKNEKKLKIVKGERATKDIIKKYGDKEVKDAYKNVKNLNLRNNYHKLQTELRDPNNKKHWMYESVTSDQDKVVSFLHEKLYDTTTSSEIFDYYVKKGYDAMVDPEDYSDGYYYPIVLFKPEKSVKRTSVRKIR